MNREAVANELLRIAEGLTGTPEEHKIFDQMYSIAQNAAELKVEIGKLMSSLRQMDINPDVMEEAKELSVAVFEVMIDATTMRSRFDYNLKHPDKWETR